MLGGAYLCYEGTEKVFEALFPHQAHEHEAQLPPVALNPQSFEDEKVASAIKTDFILSAEIMAITLAATDPALTATVLELADVAPIAESHIHASGLSDRVDIRVGDLIHRVDLCRPPAAEQGHSDRRGWATG